MLGITEQEDFESRQRDVLESIEEWRTSLRAVPERVKQEFRSKLMISLIYHDSALEGRVLSHSEIISATDTSIISDSSLIPSYEDITNFNAAVFVALEIAAQPKKVPITLELIRQLYAILNPAGKETNYEYRNDIPLHRLYFHKISPPQEVLGAVQKLEAWLLSVDFKGLSTIEKASAVHWRIMQILPWFKESGRLSRILSLLILAQDDFPLPVLHSIDRQGYYEALRSSDPEDLYKLYLEAIETTASSSIRVYQEAAAYHRAS